MDYTAREEELGGTDALLKHYVGVYDSATGKLEVMEARKMVVRGSVRAHQYTAQDETSMVGLSRVFYRNPLLTLHPQNMRERRNDLGQTFGTKKAKKAIASVTENAISPNKSVRDLENGGKVKLDAASAAMMESMAAATAGMATREQLAAEAEGAKPRPKGKFDANDVTEVYTVDSLIGLDVMKLIPVKTWQDTIKSKKEIRVASQYVARRIANAASSVEKLKLLRYMLLLLELYNSSRLVRGVRILPKRDDLKRILDEIPEVVMEGVRRKFADAGSMSKFQQDLMITHLCALAFLVDNFELDTWDLKEDLKLETKEMAQYFHEIGAKISAFSAVEGKKMGLERAAIAQRKIAKLKLPLDFPRVAFGRKR